MFSLAKMVFTYAKYPCARVMPEEYFVFTSFSEIRMVLFTLVFVLASLV